MKKDRVSADEELAQAREALKALTAGKSEEELETRLQFPHALDMSITDAALDKFKDRTNTEFQLFNQAVKALDYACLRGADPKEGNKALKLVLNKLTGKHTEEDMVKIQASITALKEVTRDAVEQTPVTTDEAKPWAILNEERAAVLNPAIKKFQNNIRNNMYQQIRDNYSR